MRYGLQRRAAAADPSLLSRVKKIETAGKLAVAAVSDSTYNLKIPALIVGAKRKAESEREPTPKRVGPLILERSQENAREQVALVPF